MHPDDKRRLQERALHDQKHWLTFEELKRRKEEARRRKAERAPRKGRHRARDVNEEDEPVDERVRASRGVAQPQRAREEEPLDSHALESARVVSVARTRATLDCAGERLEAAFAPELGLAVGDRARFERRAGGLVLVRGLEPRTGVLARPDPARPERRLVLAANVDLVLAVVAARAPRWKPGFVDRVWLAAEQGDTRCALVVNKIDLLPESERDELERELAPFAALGLPLVRASAESGHGLGELAALVTGLVCVFVGPSGVGKSSLQNALDPDHARVIGAVRDSDGKGRHTTTASEWRELPGGGALIDTPGVRQFALAGLDARTLAAGFPEIAAAAVGCRFRDCTHLVEPACGVQAALASGAIDRRRFESYARLLASLE
jgi:ribosome biogenesis GTPase